MAQYTNEQLEFVILWAKIILLVQIPFNVYLYLLIKRDFHPKFDYVLLGKYFIASVMVFGITQIIMNEYLIYEPEILKLENYVS